jgi:putative methyltransferase (TIGR04325 family)
MKTFLRNLIVRIPGLRYWVARWIFLRPGHNTHRFLGVFRTYAQAKAQVPARFDQGFDDFNPVVDEKIPERDADVVRILSTILPGAHSVFDLGGNIGMSFYQYRTRLSYPAELRWTVCDVAAVIEAGRRIAAERGEQQLEFTTDRRAANGADIYLTNGALQYFDVTCADLLRELTPPPRHLLINRVPLTEHAPFFTLQHMGSSIVPYHINNLDETLTSLAALGYRLVERWENDRFCDILLRPDRRVPHYYGFYFVRHKE